MVTEEVYKDGLKSIDREDEMTTQDNAKGGEAEPNHNTIEKENNESARVHGGDTSGAERIRRWEVGGTTYSRRRP